jgi:TatD DNase family protein
VRRLPSIDMHAHIDADISAGDLLELRSLIFAATRSLEEAEQALGRADQWTVWGVGCHPGLVRVQKAFDKERFAGLVSRTPYVSEVGLDGGSRVPIEVQRATFEAILRELQTAQRITSVHSFGATDSVLGCLMARPVQGIVLHWWLGDAEQTQRAIELGCYFSINASMLRRPDVLDRLPTDRVLTETDHPFGDRFVRRTRRPGNVDDVERALGRLHGLDEEEVRLLMWRNFATLVRQSKCGSLLPRMVRVTLAALS